MTIDDVNAASLEQFVAGIGWVFEHSPWVAERTWDQRPFASVDRLHAAMIEVVGAADRERQLALLRAHPDLGARAKMTDASQSEQAGAGLDRLTREELDRLQALNEAYRDRFGFPFLLAVKGATKHDILSALERRSSSTPDEEFVEALRQVYRIAKFRLDEMIETP
jgi:2-oxo-4-hydroxy-4-carboxy-5-ureidoimidazoline decarboxylase